MSPDTENPPAVEALLLGAEPGTRRIGLDIDPELLIDNGTVYTIPMTAAEARSTAIMLLDMAADVERMTAAEDGQP